MKTLFFTILLVVSSYATAQELNSNIINALESDNVTALKKHIATKEINNCFIIDTFLNEIIIYFASCSRQL